MPDPAPDYSIVIPAYDEERFLPATLAALRDAMAGVPLSGEIVVCDNNSRDGTAAVARAAGARVVFEPHNQIARARNTGARAARGRFLVFVDADTGVGPDLLRDALAALEGGGVAGGGTMVRFDAPVRWWGRMAVRAWDTLSTRLLLAAGSFVFVLREAWEGAGGFPESVYAGEEVWFSRAVRRWGRPRGLRFVVLRHRSVSTSARKMDWIPGWRFALHLFVMTLFPFVSRWKWFCGPIWYRRPVA